VSLELVLDSFARAPAIQELAERVPGRGHSIRLAGLPGSSGAVLIAWLARRFPARLFVVVAPSPGDAERWLSDLVLLTDAPVALYPQREALGEDEPHYEIAGERAETIESLLRGRLRVLVTTARATAGTDPGACCTRTAHAFTQGRARQPLSGWWRRSSESGIAAYPR
jgi:transcription-repair coupling factor (superfamily II helicase)